MNVMIDDLSCVPSVALSGAAFNPSWHLMAAGRRGCNRRGTGRPVWRVWKRRVVRSRRKRWRRPSASPSPRNYSPCGCGRECVRSWRRFYPTAPALKTQSRSGERAARGLKTIAFPSISTGAYGFPLERAARIAVRECRAFLAAHPEFGQIRLVCFGAAALATYQAALRENTTRASG